MDEIDVNSKKKTFDLDASSTLLTQIGTITTAYKKRIDDYHKKYSDNSIVEKLAQLFASKVAIDEIFENLTAFQQGNQVNGSSNDRLQVDEYVNNVLEEIEREKSRTSNQEVKTQASSDTFGCIALISVVLFVLSFFFGAYYAEFSPSFPFSETVDDLQPIYVGTSINAPLIYPQSNCISEVTFVLNNFTPHSGMEVESNYSEVRCETDETVSGSWSNYLGETDNQGNFTYTGLHFGTGYYTYSFKDANGQTLEISFDTSQ